LLVSRGDLGELGVGGGGRKRGAREERMDSGGIFGCGFRGCARRFTGSLVLVDKWILVAVPYCMAYSSAGHAAERGVGKPDEDGRRRASRGTDALCGDDACTGLWVGEVDGEDIVDDSGFVDIIHQQFLQEIAKPRALCCDVSESPRKTAVSGG
jgi:hypothetical protein